MRNPSRRLRNEIAARLAALGFLLAIGLLIAMFAGAVGPVYVIAAVGTWSVLVLVITYAGAP